MKIDFNKIFTHVFCGFILSSEKRKKIRNILLESNKSLDKFWELNEYAPLDFTYIDKWKNYYSENYSIIEKKLSDLKKGMDERSKEVVDLIYERNMFLSYYDMHRNIIKYDISAVFKDWEKEAFTNQQKEIRDYFLNISDLEVNAKLYQEKHLFVTDNGLKYLPEKILKYIENKDFIDGGAWVGDSAVIFGKYNPSKIYAFEPINENFIEMEKVLNSRPELKSVVVPVNAGLGEKKKTEICCQRTSGSTFLTEFFKDLPVENIDIVSIDDYVVLNNLNLGLIKLDVEGYELATIKGALASIKKFRPVLLISVYHLPEDFFEIKPLIEEQIGGYKFEMLKLMPQSPTIDTILIAYPQDI